MAKKKYLSSYKRAQSPPKMQLTARDQAILRSVYHCRLLSAEQIEALHFPSTRPRGTRTSCQTRLQKLFHNGYLDRPLLPVIMGEGKPTFVYSLDKKGAESVAGLLGVYKLDGWYRPQRRELGISFIKHTLVINSVRTAMLLLAQQGHWQLQQWLDDTAFKSSEWRERVPQLHRGLTTSKRFPDGYFQLKLPQYEAAAHFFLEVDMGTMSSSRWQSKIAAYNQFRINGLSQRYFQTNNFRILTVVDSKDRLENLKRATEEAGGGQNYWFTTADCVSIWQPSALREPVWTVATMDGSYKLF